MGDLFKLIRTDRETPLPILSCIVHFEISFAHPFLDGNGRIARLWQTAIFRKHHQAFAHIPVESMVKTRQKEYYRALKKSDAGGNTTPFIEFMLETILQPLQEFIVDVELPVRTTSTRLEAARSRFRQSRFSRKDYLGFSKKISSVTASRDLRVRISAEPAPCFGPNRQGVSGLLGTPPRSAATPRSER